MIFKKSGGILCEGNRLEAYRFIQKYYKEFGLRWLLRKFNICPNAYYNYLKNRKADYHQQKEEIKNCILDIYHSHGGVDGYRTIHVYLCRKGIMSFHSRKSNLSMIFLTVIKFFPFCRQKIQPMFVIVHNVNRTGYGITLLVYCRKYSRMNFIYNIL